ncbi:MAG: c-type cytochrome [Pseudomonadota bacterium]
MRQTAWVVFCAALAMAGCDSKSQLDVTNVQKELEAKAEKAAQYVPKIIGDTVAGKQLAVEKCALCHGVDGVAANSGAPFIAGFPQEYLTRSILAYNNGSRKNADMQAIAAALAPKEIEDISAFYASLDTPWYGDQIAAKGKPSLITKEAVVAGAVIARRCNSCHGQEGAVDHDGIFPSLAGMPPEYFIPALQAYFTGKRQHAIMKIFRDSLNKTEIEQLAAYYATRTPKKAPKPTIGNAKLGKEEAGACAGCHGYNGNSSNPHIPNLAGLPAKYLVKAITDYRDGARQDKLMRGAVQGLKSGTINNLAAYYAQQTPESLYQRAQMQSQTFDPVAEGEKIASSCAACHGEKGDSTRPGYPSLTGLHVKYLIAATRAYQSGARVNEEMATMVSHLSDIDIEKVSYYFSAQTPAAAAKTVSGDATAGEKVSAKCEACHGKQGHSKDPKNPSLAGQDQKYLISAINEYANGKRAHEGMKGAVEGLSAEEVKNVAAYYAKQTAAKPDIFLPTEPQLVIEQRCSHCHGDRGFSNEPGKPRLAGQVESYLVLAINEYQDGTRKNKAMFAVSDVLSMIEIRAIAAYYAQQRQEQQ